MRKFLPALLTAMLLMGAGCLGLGGGSSATLTPVTLNYWRTNDDPAAFTAALEAYKKLRPNVTINVTKLRAEDYDQVLLTAFAQNKGPDLFSLPNTSLGEWYGSLLPMPLKSTIPTQEVQNGKVVVTKKEFTNMNLLDFRNRFIEGVIGELVVNITEKEGAAPVQHILGLPLSADTLGMYYNREILKRGNVEKPPQSWKDLQDAAIKLTVFEPVPAGADAFNAQKVIKQSGAAIGLGRNVLHATDLLATIMAQNGTILADSYGYATFLMVPPSAQDRDFPPGVEALQFYQSFALPNSQNYSWNSSQPQSLDAFITGRTAIYFGFPIDAAAIRERAPKLDFGIAPLPQVFVGEPANVLHYPVEVVSNKTKNADVAWDFLQFLTQAEQARTFLAATKRPTALRSLIAEQLTDVDAAPFAGQVLTAKSWYKGNKYSKVEQAFATMMETYPTYEKPEYGPIVAQAVQAINETIR